MATLVQRVRGGEATRETFLNRGSSLVAEVCALNGFDRPLVDLEHGFAFVGVASDSALLRLAATNAAQPPSETRAPT